MSIYEDVTIVIVSYKSSTKVQNFIKNFARKFKIIIIENSKDIFLKNEINELYKNVEVILSENIGYGSAANLAKKKILSKYFILCNPDIEGLNDDIIKKFYNKATKIDNRFLSLGPIFNDEFNKKYTEYHKVSKISGSCMFIDSEIFDLLEGFDENIFLYFEEDDLCRRANKRKYFSYVLPEINLIHKSGTSVENLSLEGIKKLKELTLWHFIWSKYYFYKKEHGNLLSLIIFSPTLIRTLFRLAFYKIFKNDDKFNKYKMRLNGLVTSMKGLSSFKRMDN